MNYDYDVAVVGAGPGGYPAAIRAAQMGKKVVIFEREKLGGVCLNYGCIPSKALIHASDVYYSVAEGKSFGLEVKGLSLNVPALQAWRAKIVQRLNTGIQFLLDKNKVTIVKGEVVEIKYPTLTYRQEGKTKPVSVQDIILALGARPVALPLLPFDGKRVLSSKEALEFPELPQSLAVIGGGYIGIEMATYFAKFGTRVTVIELMPQILGSMDEDIVSILVKKLRMLKIEILTRSKVTASEKKENSVELIVETPEGSRKIDVSSVLVGVGFKPNSDAIQITPPLKTDAKGHFIVNEHQETTQVHIYAIGDVAGPPYLAHRATHQGLVAAQHAVHGKAAFEPRVIPSVIFCDPEIAFCGASERELKEKNIPYKVWKFPLTALGKALATQASDGFVKLLTDPKKEEILGVYILAKEAGNMIAEAALAMELGASVEDIALTIHAHPTFPEALAEAAELALDHPIHVA